MIQTYGIAVPVVKHKMCRSENETLVTIAKRGVKWHNVCLPAGQHARVRVYETGATKAIANAAQTRTLQLPRLPRTAAQFLHSKPHLGEVEVAA